MACHHAADVLKHIMLDCVHPYPRRVVLHVPPEPSIGAAILASLRDKHVGEIEIEESEEGEVKVEVDGRVRAHGLFTACRYLGRLARSYPINPANALLVDASLETLQMMVDACDAVGADEWENEKVRPFLESLESQYGTTLWLHELDRPSLSDFCWTAALHHISERAHIDATGLPNIERVLSYLSRT